MYPRARPGAWFRGKPRGIYLPLSAGLFGLRPHEIDSLSYSTYKFHITSFLKFESHE